jgi:digeranylgeranylglycerophospholipid reductase
MGEIEMGHYPLMIIIDPKINCSKRIVDDLVAEILTPFMIKDCTTEEYNRIPLSIKRQWKFDYCGMGGRYEDCLILKNNERASFARAKNIDFSGLWDDEMGIERPFITSAVLTKTMKWCDCYNINGEIDGLIVDRLKLLKWMHLRFEKLGGESIQSNLLEVEKKGNGFIIELTDNDSISCKYLIGADGAHSSVRRLVFGSAPDTFMPVEQYLIEGEGRRNEIVLRYDQIYKGKYFWSFPSSDKTKIGFPTGSQSAPDQYLEHHAREIPVGKVSHLVSGNAALIGDAAGLANAVTFGGLRTSFQSATLLVKAILDGNIDEYERGWSRLDLADPCFLDTFHMIRSMNNDQLAALVEPLRYGPNMTSIMTGLMNVEGFQKFYRSHVRKLSVGW